MAFQKMLWVDSTPIISKSLWTRWASVPKNVILFRDIESSATVATIHKEDNRIAYFAAVNLVDGVDRGLGVIFVSPHSDAIGYTYTDDWDSHYSFVRGSITHDGTTWYYSGFTEIVSSVTCVPDCVLNDTVYSLSQINTAAQDFVNQIYAVNFVDNYQSGQTYGIDFASGEEIGKTLKATLGISLFSNVLNLYNTNAAYKQLSDYADAVINAALTLIGNKKFILIDDVHIYADASQAVLRFAFNVDNTELNTKQVRITYVSNPASEGGIKYAWGGSVGVSDKFRVQSGEVRITNDGTITSGASSSVDWLSTFWFGVNLHSAISPYTGKSPRASNINIIL